MDNKIAIVVAYFGKFPHYFPLWLRSCEYNETIDFIIVTDQIFDTLPQNVRIVKMSLSEMQERASKILGFEAKLGRPYKCCDYRPMYGVIFNDYLETYDYWGHCDIDLIFGDLQSFFIKFNLYDYDKFGCLGHLSLYRNTDKVNNAYKIQSHNILYYKDVYTTDNSCIFDEVNGITAIMLQNGFKVFTQRIFIDIVTMYSRYRIIEVYPLDEKAVNYPVQSFYWSEGKVFHVYVKDNAISQDEYIYVHFQKRPNFDVNEKLIKADSFYITKYGFFVKQSHYPEIRELKKLNPYYGVIYERVEYLANLIVRKLRAHLKRLG